MQAVFELSESESWDFAVREWSVYSLEEDPTESGVCVCGNTGLSKLFTLRNDLNGSFLNPIGSVCVNQFGRRELNGQVTLLNDLQALRNAINAREAVTLESGHFTRALLEYLHARGAFTPDKWNGHNGYNDYDFLLKMFNKKKKKNEITPARRRKITMLLRTKVFPFVQQTERLR